MAFCSAKPRSDVFPVYNMCDVSQTSDRKHKHDKNQTQLHRISVHVLAPVNLTQMRKQQHDKVKSSSRNKQAGFEVHQLDDKESKHNCKTSQNKNDSADLRTSDAIPRDPRSGAQPR